MLRTFVIVAILLLAACTAESESLEEAFDRELSEEHRTALGVVEELADGADFDVSTISFPNGDFGYMLARIERSGGDLPSDKVVVLGDGRIVSLSEAERLFAIEFERRWGAIDLDAAARIIVHGGRTPMPFYADLDHEGTECVSSWIDRVRTFYPDVRYRSGSDTYFEASLDHVLTVNRQECVLMIGWGEASTGRDILPGETAAGYSESLYYWNANQSFGQDELPVSNDPIKVGINDQPRVNNDENVFCPIFDDHEAFAFIEKPVLYTNVPFDVPDTCSSSSDCPGGMQCSLATNPRRCECSTDSDCNSFKPNNGRCGPGGHCYHAVATEADRPPTTCSNDTDCERCDGNCMGGECRIDHTTSVASRISSSVGAIPAHAAKVQFVIDASFSPKSFAPGNGASGHESYRFATEGILETGAVIINESWSEKPVGGGLTRIAREREDLINERRHLVVKSAGNWDDSPCPNAEDLPLVSCSSLSALCVGGTVNIGLDLDYQNDEMFCRSRWMNQYSFNTLLPGSQQLEIERPDVVTEGWDAYVASLQGPTTWERVGGNSISAPTVIGLMALARQTCFQGSQNFQSFGRALLKLLSTRRNNLETNNVSSWKSPIHFPPPEEIYPIPGHSNDSLSGAGLALAREFACNPWSPMPPDPDCDPEEDECSERDFQQPDRPDEVVGGSEDTAAIEDPTSWTKTPTWMDADDLGQNPTNRDDWDSVPGGAVTSSPLKTSSAEGAEFRPLNLPRGYPAGTRFRAVLVMNTCATDLTKPGLPVRDYDLAACSFGKKKCYGVSESWHDSTEGFDVIIDENVSDLTLLLIRNANDSSTCSGSPSSYGPRVDYVTASWLP